MSKQMQTTIREQIIRAKLELQYGKIGSTNRLDQSQYSAQVAETAIRQQRGR